MNNELVSFLLPRFEPLQMFFFLFITGATLLTGLMVALRANEHHWEKKWQGGKLGTSGLRAASGSIHSRFRFAPAAFVRRLPCTLPSGFIFGTM